MTKRITCVVLLFCAATVSSRAQITFSTLASFYPYGREPQLPPVQGVDGNFYGVTYAGGLKGAGIVYKITPEGTLDTLYSFCSQTSCADGEFPLDGVIAAADGNLYGTTWSGGLNDRGTAFKLTLQGELTSLYSFCSQENCLDGSSPSGLIQATNGNFYGMTLIGGAHDAGTIFSLTPQGVLTTLYNFCSQPNCADGYNIDESVTSLVEGSDGNFYGTNDLGGNQAGICSVYGCGTAFKITPEGTFTTLYSFCSKVNCADGAIPYRLIQGSDGYLYGVTGSGGTPYGKGGTFFKLSTNGVLTTLFSFCEKSGCKDGFEPIGLIQAAGSGNFYGVTFQSSKCRGGCGSVFEIMPTGAVTLLHTFDGTDGDNPYGLTQATSGTFYGVTSSGGTHGDGTVFSISIGLPPFVETLQRLGKVGTRVTILGTNLTGSTAVSFNGTTATFNVVSVTEIRTTVPASATSGSITVTTPSGILTSNKPFRVIP
jgi:uncharacterized repeat protein (TIGR03803 family)